MTALGDKVGNDGGWHLHFFAKSEVDPVLSVGVADYYASIDATLPSNLEGGSYTFSIEGITNAHYQALHDAYTSGKPLYVDLYLYWRDAGGVLGYLANVAGLSDTLAGKPSDDARVARLRVTRLRRRVGARRYEAVIEACERVYAALRVRPTPPLPSADNPRAAAIKLVDPLLSSIDPLRSSYVDEDAPDPPAGAAWPKYDPRAWRTALDGLAELERSMIALAGKTGRGMYLIRDGVLHIGVRDIPLDGGDPVAIDDHGGLAHIETGEVSQTERAAAPGDTPPARLQYTLICKGRPDIRPGDKLFFTDPSTDSAGKMVDPSLGLGATTTPSSFGEALQGMGTSLFGGASALAGTQVEMYVSSVHHTLSRTDGFVTTITGVHAKSGEEWDKVDRAQGATNPDPTATPHADVASAIKQLTRGAGGEPMVVGEVRAATVSGQNEPPGQTIDAWVGTVNDDGGPHRSRRLAIDRDAKSQVTGVPYATPFAWGKCGLVLPRYPGTRVLVDHVGGRVDDPIDVGALWESGHGPESSPGDWWLILPAAVDAAKRQSASDDETPQEPASHATNDLIDADGARVIEVGRLTVRVQPKQLAAPGTRPPAPSDAAEQVTIEHENGSRIVIKDNGDIVIHSEANLTLSAKQTMTLQADSVAVKVAKKMDVTDP